MVKKAWKYGLKNNFRCANNETEFEGYNVTEKNKLKYLKYKELINENKESNNETSIHVIDKNEISKNKEKSNFLSIQDEEIVESEFNDTVGGICIDSQEEIASCVSSGGIWMKNQGRVGEASM
jgi:isoaspartyl peptidase/L-asparaginase-like protein (Ntn-hydrolase superfamily)